MTDEEIIFTIKKENELYNRLADTIEDMNNKQEICSGS